MADLAQKFAVGTEFEKLCGRCRIGRAGGIAARQDEDVALGIERDTTDFAEIHIVRQLERIRHGLEINDRRRLLGKGWRAGKQPRESKSDKR